MHLAFFLLLVACFFTSCSNDNKNNALALSVVAPPPSPASLGCITRPANTMVAFNGQFDRYGDNGQRMYRSTWYEAPSFPPATGGTFSIVIQTGGASGQSKTNVKLAGSVAPCRGGGRLCGTISGPISGAVDGALSYQVELACHGGKARLTGAGKLTKFDVPLCHQALLVEWTFDNNTATVEGVESFIEIDGEVNQNIWEAFAT